MSQWLADGVTVWTNRKAATIILLLGAGMVAGYVTALSAFPRGGRALFGDAAHHFVQLRSMVFDHDLHFQNEYTRIYGLKDGEPGAEWVSRNVTATGHVRNYMPVGPALLWMPLYAFTAAVQWVLSVLGLVRSPDGFELVLQLTAGITGIAAATAAAWISFRMAARETSASSAATATVAIWTGTHALYYSLVSPAYSHAPSMLTSALFFSSWLCWRPDLSIARLAALGAMAGAAALMRWQDALFVVVPIVEIARWKRPWTTRMIGAASASAAWTLIFLPQMVVWFVLYGRPFTLPQGPSFMQWTSPHPIAVLLSDSHGLFTWAPLLVLALIGLVGFMRRHPSTAVPLAIVCCLSWYVNAAVSDWWAGEAFGARRFLSLFPLFVLGLAQWLTPGTLASLTFARRLGLVAVLIVANLLLLLQYQLALKGLEMISPYPHGPFDMWVTRFLVPLRLLAWWAS